MKKYSIKKFLLEELDPNEIAPEGGTYGSQLPSDPTEGHYYELTIMQAINRAVERGAAGDKQLDKAAGMKAGSSKGGTLDYDVGVYTQQGKKLDTSSGTSAKVQTRIETKSGPAQMGKINKASWKDFLWTGSGWTYGQNDQWKQVTGGNYTVAELKVIQDALCSNSNVINTFSDIIDSVTSNENWPEGKEIPTQINFRAQCHVGLGLTKEEFNVIAADLKSKKVGLSPTVNVPNSGADFINFLGKKKDILILGPGGKSRECIGEVFSLNDATAAATGIPKIQVTDIKFRVGMKKSADYGWVFESQACSASNSGLSFSSEDELYEIIRNVNPELKAISAAIKSAGDDTAKPSMSVGDRSKDGDWPGMGINQFRSSKGPLNPANREPRLYNPTPGNLELSHRKRKYSIKARLLGKK